MDPRGNSQLFGSTIHHSVWRLFSLFLVFVFLTSHLPCKCCSVLSKPYPNIKTKKYLHCRTHHRWSVMVYCYRFYRKYFFSWNGDVTSMSYRVSFLVSCRPILRTQVYCTIELMATRRRHVVIVLNQSYLRESKCNEHDAYSNLAQRFLLPKRLLMSSVSSQVDIIAEAAACYHHLNS